MSQAPGYFHLHLVSDSTGETLITVGRAAAAQYTNVMPVEHVHPRESSPPWLCVYTVDQRPRFGKARTDHSTVALDHRIKVACSMAPPGQR